MLGVMKSMCVSLGCSKEASSRNGKKGICTASKACNVSLRIDSVFSRLRISHAVESHNV
jgi:hypothetical protein